MFIRNCACWGGESHSLIIINFQQYGNIFTKIIIIKKSKTIHISNQFKFYHHKWLLETLWKKSIKSKWEVTIPHLIKVNFAFYVLISLGWGRERKRMQGQTMTACSVRFHFHAAVLQLSKQVFQLHHFYKVLFWMQSVPFSYTVTQNRSVVKYSFSIHFSFMCKKIFCTLCVQL